jgi:uncharacterized membrane protein
VSSFVLFILIFGLGLMLMLTRQELRLIRERLDGLEGRRPGPAPGEEIAAASPEPQPEARVAAKARRTAAVVSTDALRPPAQAAAQSPPEEPRPSPFASLNFENLVGGKLPIWVGGISLVFAGFFLVRYTIEAGLFGPGARAVTATLFAFAMIAMSELGGRLPRVGASFTADPRVGQSLAGAGVATLYGTLYMAAEIYALIGVPTAFVLVVITTAIAFALSLRHGPPTALMGLIGGFAAPWVAGMGASNLPTLLLYLAVFIAALFGLAVWRRWLWLLVLASGGGALWSFAMLARAQTDLSLLAGFIALTGAGALLAAQRFKDQPERSSPERGGGAANSSLAVTEGSPSPLRGGLSWSGPARYLPIALALVQLAILLPRMAFSVTGWLFYFALSALAIALAWRDRLLVPLVGGALLLSAIPLTGAWSEYGASTHNIVMTLGIAILFAGAGHVRSRANDAAALPWALIGLAAPVLCYFTAYMTNFTGMLTNSDAASDRNWGLVALLSALPGMYMAWQWHSRKRTEAVQGWATAAAALMLWMSGITWIGGDYWASHSALVALAVAAWAKITGGRAERRIAILPLGTAMLAGLAISYEFIEALVTSLSGGRALFDYLPLFADAALKTLLPAVLILAITWQPWLATGRKTRAIAFAVGGAGVAAIVWLIAKQPAAIATPGAFILLGFAERAIFTQILFGLGWLALDQAKKRPDWPSLRIAGWVLAGVACFRVVWFDLLLLNPVMVPQMVGPVPVANLATGHLALTALWLWLMARAAPLRFVLILRGLSLGMMIVTVLASIRQAVQGTLMSGANIETGENYLYSAGLLALALAWLTLGMMRGTRLLRVAGLSLLTVVTLKVFLVDAAALTGLLRILSFLGLGIALIGIGWAYGRVMGVAGNKTN